jgi:hypothetical protein
MADIVTDISVNKNWNARKGSINPVTFVFTSSFLPFDITNYTFSVQLRKFGYDTNLLNLTQGSGITNNGALGTLNVTFTSANLAQFAANDYYWQMTVVHPDASSYLWFQGTFNLFDQTYTGDLTTFVNEVIDVNGTTINCFITLLGNSGGSGVGAWVNKGTWDASTNLFPSTSVLAGYQYFNTTNSTTLFMPDGGIIPAGAIIVAKIDAPGQTVGNWYFLLSVT